MSEHGRFLKTLLTRHSAATLAIAATLALVHLALRLTHHLSVTPTSVQLYRVGAGYGIDCAHGQPWRLFTEIFLHGSTDHLISNILGLLCAGVLLDWLIGATGVLAIFILGGFFGSLLSAIFHPIVVAVGASGAIFGIYGALIAGLFHSARLRESKVARAFFIGFGIQAILSLVAGFQDPHTDNFAHLGGLFAGFTIMCVWYLNKNDHRHRQFTFASAGTIILCTALVILPHVVRSEALNPIEAQRIHDRDFEQMTKLDELTAEFKNRVSQLSDDQALTWTRDDFLPRFHVALEDLRKSLDDQAPTQSEEQLRQAIYNMHSTCAHVYEALASEARGPASVHVSRIKFAAIKVQCRVAQETTYSIVDGIKHTQHR